MAESVELLRAAETDGYGRTLGYLFVNGRNYSVLVITAGYAVETVSHYGDNGLPEESEAVLAASRDVGPVPFEAPYQFRRAHARAERLAGASGGGRERGIKGQSITERMILVR